MFGEMGLSKIWFSEYEQKLQADLNPEYTVRKPDTLTIWL